MKFFPHFFPRKTADPDPARAKRSSERWRGFAFAVVATMLAATAVLGPRQLTYEKGFVVIGDGIRARVAIARTVAARERGLSGRKGLAPDEGMLFIFDAADTYGFWMKEMLFPIDILWLNGSRIVDISTDLPPSVPGDRLPVFYPRVPADRVLEVPAGFAKVHGLKLDMPVEYHVDR